MKRRDVSIGCYFWYLEGKQAKRVTVAANHYDLLGRRVIEADLDAEVEELEEVTEYRPRQRK